MSKEHKNKNSRGFHVLIAAGGSGVRTGFDTPKQYKPLHGKPVIRHTLEKFISLQGLKSIRVVIGDGHESLYHAATAGLALPPFVIGAGTRKESVYNGLCSYADDEQDDIVLIHDAARPFLSATSVYNLLAAMDASNAATLACPMADTLVTGEYETLDRNNIYGVQTPQAFCLGVIKSAHEKYKHDDTFTDDAGLMAAMGEKVTLVPSPRDNFKITTNEDFIMAEKLLSSQTQIRTGFGYDVHAFDPAPASHTRLGGIDIPHSRKLLGHSDADVVLHALTDALLGTIGDGDIGQLFPPSDVQWKNADSAIFLAEALKRIHAKGGILINADITLVAEEPKIGHHRAAMQSRLAHLLGISPSRIGLKATTSEGLGFVGERKGIEAQAVVSIQFPSDME
jgi:2-C-methyl-D-erythritol 4-phosphate cytidylyltransferase/2-C-methyl-D-erythritol 2,4-cyclodiphosphate synthase